MSVHCLIHISYSEVADPCLTNPCQNDGICRPADLQGTTYSCLCHLGFTGTLCESGSYINIKKI